MDTHLGKTPARRRTQRRPKLLGALLAAALAVAAVAAPAASAGPFHDTFTYDDHDQFNADNPCGYVILVENAGTVYETGYYDDANDQFTRDVFTQIGAFTFTNPANGKSVTGTYAKTERSYLDGSGGAYIDLDGLRMNIVVPGQGSVLVRAGRLVTHIDDIRDDNSPTEEVFRVGTGGELFQALCPALN